MAGRENNRSDKTATSEESIFSEASDRVDNLAEYLERSLNVVPHSSASITLKRWFSLHSQSTAASPLAGRQNLAVLDPRLQKFKHIGRGQCGTVFEITGQDKVLKKANSSHQVRNLFEDYKIGLHVWETFQAVRILQRNDSILPKTPKYTDFLLDSENEDFENWWQENVDSFPKDFQERQTCLTEERIPPLPKPVRDALIDELCHPDLRSVHKNSPTNKDCIARLYLGRLRHQSTGRFFTLRNCLIYLDDAKRIIQWDDILRYVTQMANALAVMHFFCEVDANDVEFVLGSSPTLGGFEGISSTTTKMLSQPFFYDAETSFKNCSKRTIHLWTLDSDKVKRMKLNESGIQQAVEAAHRNDPYFPQAVPDDHPDFELWELFSSTYLDTAQGVLSLRRITGCDSLPGAFLKGYSMKKRNGGSEASEP